MLAEFFRRQLFRGGGKQNEKRALSHPRHRAFRRGLLRLLDCRTGECYRTERTNHARPWSAWRRPAADRSGFVFAAMAAGYNADIVIGRPLVVLHASPGLDAQPGLISDAKTAGA